MAAGVFLYIGQNEGLLGRLAIKSRTQTSREVKMGYNFTGKYVAQLENEEAVLYDLVQTDVQGSFSDIKGTSQYQDMKGTADGQGYQSGGEEKTTLIGTYKKNNIVYKNNCWFLISDLKLDSKTGAVLEFSGKCDLRINDQVVTTMGIKGAKVDKNIPAYNYVDFTGSYSGKIGDNEYSLELWQPTPGLEEVTKMPIPLAAISFGGSTQGIGGGLIIKDQINTWPIVVKYGQQFLIKYTVSKYEKNEYGNVTSFSGNFLKQETNGTDSTGTFAYRALVDRVNYSVLIEARKTAVFGAILGVLSQLQQAYSSADPRQTVADFVAGKLELAETPQSPTEWQALISTQISMAKEEVKDEVLQLVTQLAGYTGLFIDGLIEFLEKPINFTGNYMNINNDNEDLRDKVGMITMALYQSGGLDSNKIAGVSFLGVTPGIVVGYYDKEIKKIVLTARYPKTDEYLKFQGDISDMEAAETLEMNEVRTNNVYTFSGEYWYYDSKESFQITTRVPSKTGTFEFGDLQRGAWLVKQGVDNAQAIRAEISTALQQDTFTTYLSNFVVMRSIVINETIDKAILAVSARLPDRSNIADVMAALSEKRDDLPQGKEDWRSAIINVSRNTSVITSRAIDELAEMLEDRGTPVINTLIDFIEAFDDKLLNFTGNYVGDAKSAKANILSRPSLLTFELWQKRDGTIVGRSAYGKAKTQDGGFSYSFGDVVVKGTTCGTTAENSSFIVVYDEAIKMDYLIDCTKLVKNNFGTISTFKGKYTKYDCVTPSKNECLTWSGSSTEGTFEVESSATIALDHLVTLAGRLGNAKEALSEVELQEWIDRLSSLERAPIDWQAMIDKYLKERPDAPPINPPY